MAALLAAVSAAALISTGVPALRLAADSRAASPGGQPPLLAAIVPSLSACFLALICAHCGAQRSHSGLTAFSLVLLALTAAVFAAFIAAVAAAKTPFAPASAASASAATAATVYAWSLLITSPPLLVNGLLLLLREESADLRSAREAEREEKDLLWKGVPAPSARPRRPAAAAVTSSKPGKGGGHRATRASALVSQPVELDMV